MNTLPLAIEAALLALAAAAAAYDLKCRRIPNWLTAAGICVGFALNGFLSGLPGLARAGLGLGLAAAVYLPMFALRAMGGGDVKLMAAVGAMTGAADWFAVFLITAVVGGVIALSLLAIRGGVRKTVLNVLDIFRSLIHLRAPYRARPELDVAHSSAVTLPHGVSIAVGSFLFVVLSHNLT